VNSPTENQPDGGPTPWERYLESIGTKHARDFAREFGMSEAALVASGVGRGVVRLRPRWQEIFAALPSLGRVKTLTRNEHVVLEHWGSYAGEGAIADGPHFDVRLFFRNFAFAFAVDEPGKNGIRSSLQFFDRYGDSIHKVYLEDSARRDALLAIATSFAASSYEVPFEVEPKRLDSPRTDGDPALVRAGWDAMQDTHDFVGLLARLKLGRVQALYLAGDERARKVPNDALGRVLARLAETRLPCMIFVANRGIMQIFIGAIERVKWLGEYVNVLDQGFNLHARERGIAESFIVRKPTVDGTVSSLELYDEAGETLALLFSKRNFGEPESEAWRALLLEVS
jgi:putative hemin transport protein